MRRTITGHSRFLRQRARWMLPIIAGLIALLWPAATWAHPLGNFTVNRYSRLELHATAVQIVYIIDMAEIPAFQEISRIDGDHDGTINAAENAQYLAQQVDRLRENLHLNIGGARLPLQAEQQELTFPTGQGGLRTLRLSVRFAAALPEGQVERQAEYRDDNYAERLGWKEIVIRADPDTTLLDSTAPAEDRSQELRSYPQDLLQSPMDVRSATFRFKPGASPGRPSPGAPRSMPVQGRATDQFATLITTANLTPVTLLLTLVAAFGLGAAHALAPGHGKTVVAAYLVGSRGTARHALFLGLTTTITHTAGVFALGIITLFVSEFILPEQLYPWLGVVSGLLVFGIGVALFRGRVRAFIEGSHGHARAHDHDHDHAHGGHVHSHLPPVGHAHAHDHDHHHDHDHDHAHGGHVHSHLPPGADGSRVTWRNLLALGVSGGLLPCPSALVVLLSAIALGRVGFGLLLILAFSLGLASVLTAIGVLLVHAKRLFDRIPMRGRMLLALPIVSAVVVLVAGLGITLQALTQTGLLRI